MDKRRASSSVEEEAGVLKSGIVVAAFAPVKTKKTYYAVLGERALELHENEKSRKKKRHARHLIDLSTCFNINRHFDGRLKYCVAVMTPDETLLLRAETDAMCDEWYDVLISALIPARALRLGRPVQPNEFFECAWDVTLVDHPRLRKSLSASEQLVNICKKDPSLLGPHRLCFYPHTIILCRRGIEPASLNDLPQSGIPPFKATDFIELPRHYVASFGCRERYFFMKMGHSSSSGSAELWAMCDSEEVAGDVHSKLNKIIERESEKKKQMPNGPLLPSSPVHQGHRNRSHTHSGVHRTAATTSKKLSADEMSLKERRAQLHAHKWAADLIEEKTSREKCTLSPGVVSFQPFDSASSKPKYSSSASVLPHRQSSSVRRIDRTRSFESKNSLPSSLPNITKNTKAINKELSLQNWQQLGCPRLHSSLSSSPAAEETEDSGGTMRTIDAEEEANRAKTELDRQIEATIERMLPAELKEQFMSHSDSRKAFSAVSGGGHLEFDDRADGMSCSAAGSTSTNEDFLQTTPGETSEDNLEYARMEMISWSSGSASHLGATADESQFAFEEVRSYLSEGNDSCYSSMATNTPRAYSFGASHIIQQQQQQQPRHSARKHTHAECSHLAPDSQRYSATLPQSEIIHHSNKPSPSASAFPEDARKRAFSLGSKSWFQKPFRKFSRDFVSRAHRLSNTSQASSGSSAGHSLVHSPNSSVLPTTPQAFIAPDPYPMSRVRSESICSGRSTPNSGRLVSNDISSDHVPVDFSGISFGKSTSGSVHSTDSPSRSRTSSFGCGQRCYGIRDPGDIVIHALDSELESTLASAPRRNHDSSREHYNESLCMSAGIDEWGEYVLRSPPDACFSDFYMNSPRVGYEGQVSSNSYPDSRSSQLFETIQESLSGRSSPASLKDAGSSHSPKGQEFCDTRNLKLESAFSIEKGIDESQVSEQTLSNADVDSEYVPMDPPQ